MLLVNLAVISTLVLLLIICSTEVSCASSEVFLEDGDGRRPPISSPASLMAPRGSHIRSQRAIDINMSKVTGIIGPDAVVKLTAVKLAVNLMIATGWLWAGE